MPEFETFHQGLSAQNVPMSATLNRRGILSVNLSAYAALGSPAAVELLFDRTDSIIGLLPADHHAHRAHIVRMTRPASNVPYLITAVAFVRYYEIVVLQTHRWIPYLDDGVLCIDIAALRSPVETPPSTTSRTSVAMTLEAASSGTRSSALSNRSTPPSTPSTPSTPPSPAQRSTS